MTSKCHRGQAEVRLAVLEKLGILENLPNSCQRVITQDDERNKRVGSTDHGEGEEPMRGNKSGCALQRSSRNDLHLSLSASLTSAKVEDDLLKDLHGIFFLRAFFFLTEIKRA